MDPSIGSSNISPSQLPSQGHPTRTNSTQSVQSPNDNVADRAGDALKRGHSDGDVLARRLNERRRTSTESGVGGSETWVDFLRTSPGDKPNAATEFQLAANRAALTRADRMKRLAKHREEYSRRTASGSLSLVSPPAGRSGQGSAEVGADTSFARPTTSFDRPGAYTQRITDHPLPQVPNIDTVRDRRSQETALPKWQPDTEVNKCPICRTAFSFWYRKHHCRKCGRVVCGNCSPHRITIPRQFIVHPPEEAAASPTSTESAGVEIVDLTGDNDPNDIAPNSNERPQSSDYKIDPALGGGQEVRLCNPCVPDPNPLPHVPHPPPPNVTSFEAFHNPGQALPQHQPASIPGSTLPADRLPQALARRGSAGRSPLRNDSSSNFDGSMASRESWNYPGIVTLTSRRHSHAPRPSNQAMPPPGYSSLYGSAPDQIARQRELAAFLQNQTVHRHHRQHASVGHIPSAPRHRFASHHAPTQPAPAPPRPQLREEDECPICHQALPPKGPDNSEVAREAHVQFCIETHFSSSAPRSTHPPPAAAPGAAVAASASTPSQAAGPRPVPAGHRASVGSNDMPSASLQQRRRVAGMLAYQASEKDCVGEDREGMQECVICFEEFAVGVEMARLECLCKFHKVR